MRDFQLQGAEGVLALSGAAPSSMKPYRGWEYRAELNSHALTAKVDVHDHLPGRFREFFEQIASDWQGWSGSREYESLEPTFRISATHNGIGKVFFNVLLSAGAETMFDWSASQVLTVDPGALERIAAKACAFVE